MYREFQPEQLRVKRFQNRQWLCFGQYKAIYRLPASGIRVMERRALQRPFYLHFGDDTALRVNRSELERLCPFLEDLLNSTARPLESFGRLGRFSGLGAQPKIAVGGLAFFNFHGNLVLAARPYVMTRMALKRVDAEALHFILSQRLEADRQA